MAGNKSVGTIEDYIYINSYLLNGLDRMIAAPQLDHLTGASSEEKFNYFMNRDKDLNDFESDKFKINFGTMSDAFTIRAYRRLNELVILWKMWRDDADIQFSDLVNYGNDIHEYSTSYAEVSKYVHAINCFLAIPNLLLKNPV